MDQEFFEAAPLPDASQPRLDGRHLLEKMRRCPRSYFDDQDEDGRAWGSADFYFGQLILTLGDLLCKDCGKEDLEACWTRRFLEAWLVFSEAKEKDDHGKSEKDPVLV